MFLSRELSFTMLSLGYQGDGLRVKGVVRPSWDDVIKFLNKEGIFISIGITDDFGYFGEIWERDMRGKKMRAVDGMGIHKDIFSAFEAAIHVAVQYLDSITTLK